MIPYKATVVEKLRSVIKDVLIEKGEILDTDIIVATKQDGTEVDNLREGIEYCLGEWDGKMDLTEMLVTEITSRLILSYKI